MTSCASAEGTLAGRELLHVDAECRAAYIVLPGGAAGTKDI